MPWSQRPTYHGQATHICGYLRHVAVMAEDICLFEALDAYLRELQVTL
jgi:hypothetical protein